MPLTILVAQTPNADKQGLDRVVDKVAYTVYAAVLPTAWARVSKEEMLLQRESEPVDAVIGCLASVSTADAEWYMALTTFKSENARAKVIDRMLPIQRPYALISQAQILADDTRLERKYPGMWQRRPESLEYVAVSAVGFNTAKTKAILYVRLRSSGELLSMELREGKWVISTDRGGCGWTA